MSKKTSDRARVGFWLPPEVEQKARAAYFAEPGKGSLSSWYERTLLAHVERTETERNGGKPFPLIPPGARLPGRPGEDPDAAKELVNAWTSREQASRIRATAFGVDKRLGDFAVDAIEKAVEGLELPDDVPENFPKGRPTAGG